MDTERGVLNTGVYWGEKGRASGRGRCGGIAWGQEFETNLANVVKPRLC